MENESQAAAVEEVEVPTLASTQLSSEDQIKFLVKARYPLIYVVSPEEERVEKVMVRVANDCKTKVVTWSITQGFSQQGGGDVREPVAALNYMIDAKESAIFVLRDYHEYINNHGVKRRLRDLARDFRSCQKNCILLSPLQKIPPEAANIPGAE